MGNARGWLLIAASVGIALAAGTGIGRFVLRLPVTPIASTSSVLPSAATTSSALHNDPSNAAANNKISCFDTSPHRTIVVTVAPDVQLEVLDWGGTGDMMVLLTGLGDNAHVYDEFAYQFTDRF